MHSGLRMHRLCAQSYVAQRLCGDGNTGAIHRGTTVVDIEGRLGQPANARVALEIDVVVFQRWGAGTGSVNNKGIGDDTWRGMAQGMAKGF